MNVSAQNLSALEYAEKIARVRAYVALGYSAMRIAKLLEVELRIVAAIKAGTNW